MDGGKLSEVNARTESRRQNELVGKFKMVGVIWSVLGGRLWSNPLTLIYFHHHLSAPAMSTDSSQVGVAIFPSF